MQSLAETVGQPSSDLAENVPLVVVTQCPCHLVIRHTRSVSVLSPQGSESRGVVETKEPLLLVLPRDHVGVLRLAEYSKSKLPELGRGWDICQRERERRRKVFHITQVCTSSWESGIRGCHRSKCTKLTLNVRVVNMDWWLGWLLSLPLGDCGGNNECWVMVCSDISKTLMCVRNLVTVVR